MKKPTTKSFTHNNSIMVKNINGTSKPTYAIANLKTKFTTQGGHFSATCQAKCCAKPASATAHVKFVDQRKTQQWQLTSVCASHNHHTNKDAFALRKNAKLIAVIDLTKK